MAFLGMKTFLFRTNLVSLTNKIALCWLLILIRLILLFTNNSFNLFTFGIKGYYTIDNKS